MRRAEQLTFADAGALVSVLDRTMPDHRIMATSWLLAFDSGSTLVTTGFDVLRASQVLHQRHGAAGPEALPETVLPALRVEWCGPVDFALAVAGYLASGNRPGNGIGDQGGESRREGAEAPADPTREVPRRKEGKDLAEHLDDQVRRRLGIQHMVHA